MKTEIIRKNNMDIAVISNDELLVTNAQSALYLTKGKYARYPALLLSR